jgi:diguanylate cyclase (GGDEF)-like protein
VRQAAFLFAFAGGLGLVTSYVPGAVGYGSNGLRLVDLLGLAVAGWAWLGPWDRWERRATLVFPAAAMFLIAASHYASGVPATIYGVWYMVLFAWVGLWHPPRTSLLIGPVAAVVYVVPFLIESSPVAGATSSVLIAIPAAVTLGEVMARTVARANADRDEKLELLAAASVTDDLTGIGNRRHANTLLDALAPGDGLLVLDLDNFKSVNDRFGHAEGDRVLSAFGTYLADMLPATDDVARFGGEEFLVVLRAAGESAREVAELLLEGWRSLVPRTTFSVGVAVHAADRSPSLTFGEADSALFLAKRDGRDRVAVFEASTHSAIGR